MIMNELFFTVLIFGFFTCYGFSNIYIIAYLRKKADYVVGVLEAVTLFMGNIKNHIDLNNRFRKAYVLEGDKVPFNNLVCLVHLVSPVLIPISILAWVLAIGLY